MADNIEIRRLRPGDGEYVAAHMRACDREEIMCLGFIRPLPAIRMTLAHNVAAWTGLKNGEIGCIFGINRKTLTSDVGVPWLLGTPVMETVPTRFLKESVEYYKRMERAFPQMENFVLCDNTKAVNWLKWLGFKMHEPFNTLIPGKMAMRFTRGMD